jgi:hypothetical protein
VTGNLDNNIFITNDQLKIFQKVRDLPCSVVSSPKSRSLRVREKSLTIFNCLTKRLGKANPAKRISSI